MQPNYIIDELTLLTDSTGYVLGAILTQDAEAYADAWLELEQAKLAYQGDSNASLS
jgi:hypothetical protein